MIGCKIIKGGIWEVCGHNNKVGFYIWKFHELLRHKESKGSNI